VWRERERERKKKREKGGSEGEERWTGLGCATPDSCNWGAKCTYEERNGKASGKEQSL
jgi:hypothetical protein